MIGLMCPAIVKVTNRSMKRMTIAIAACDDNASSPCFSVLPT